MKYVVLVPDGLADHPCEEIEGKTPLEASKTPNMNFFAKMGRVGMTRNVPPRMEPASDVANLSILGYDPKKYYTGRGPLEAANMGISLAKNEVAFRMNLVTESEGILADYSAGHISTKEARILVEYLAKKLSSDFVRFYPGVGYRHLAVIKDSHGFTALSARCVPPHEITGEPIEKHLPKGPGDELLKKLMFDARMLLQDHEINRVRIDLKENPANLVWFWGQGVTPNLDSFEKRYGVKGSVISAVDLVKGMGRLIGLDVINVPGATGYVDTDYEAKGRYAVQSLENKDFVFVHVEATDEASHEGKIKLKMTAIEDFDHYVVGAIRKYFEKNSDTRVLIVPDHATPCKMRDHARDPVPFIISGKNIVPDEIEKYSETTARYSKLKFNEGHKLMGFFIFGK